MALGSSDGSLVAAPDCKPAVTVRIRHSPQPNVPYSGLTVLRWTAFWVGCPESWTQKN
jgi:hypothetical protein